MSQKSVLSFILFTLIILVSCSSNNTEQSKIEVSKTPIPTNTLTATPTLENTFGTPIPTLSNIAEQKLVQVINLRDCILPCYMGITPGKTKLEDAKILLESLGAKFLVQGTQDNGKWITYEIKLDEPLIETFEPAYKDSKNVFNSLSLISVDGVVQKIHIWILAHGFSQKAQGYWSRYTPKGVFLQIGVPDEIYSASGSLALIYKDLGIINTYETFWKDGQLCPQNEIYRFDRRFEIINPDSPVEIYSEHENALKYREIWSPIDESLGITVQEFYKQVIADDSICFDIKTK